MKPLIGEQITQRQIDVFAAWRYGANRPIREAVRMARLGIMPISGGGEVALRRTQAGLEGTRGTIAAATRRVYGSGMMDRVQSPIFPQNEDRGTLVENYRAQMGLVEAMFPFKASATYEDLPWWCELGLKGGVAPTGPTNTTVYTDDFQPTQTSDDLKTATFEWGDDTQAWVMPFGFLESFEIVGAMGRPWELTANVIGKDMTTQTFTGALSDRVVEDIETHLTKLAYGNAGAVPVSYVTGQVVGFKFSANNNPYRKFFMDGASPSVMGGMGRKKRHYSLEVTWEELAATITERATWPNGTQRVVNLLATGSNIAGSGPATNRSAQIIIPGIWQSWKVGNRETNTIWTAVIDSMYDATLGYDLRVTIQNALAALP